MRLVDDHHPDAAVGLAHWPVDDAADVLAACAVLSQDALGQVQYRALGRNLRSQPSLDQTQRTSVHPARLMRPMMAGSVAGEAGTSRYGS